MSAEDLVGKIFKRILVVVLGSGVLVNALYLFGNSYYEGLVKSLGFDVLMFPIGWSDGMLWMYIASQEIGIGIFNIWVESMGAYVVLLGAVCYISVRIWLETKRQSKEEMGVPRWLHSKLLRLGEVTGRFFGKFSSVFEKYCPGLSSVVAEIYKITVSILSWFFKAEEAFFAFIAAYSLVIFLFFIPLFLFAWSFYPMIGFSYGENIGERLRKKYEKELCGKNSEYWSSCLSFPTKHIDQKGLPEQVLGRLILKEDRVIGVYTKNGPITMTLPDDFYQVTQRNPCYMMTCPNPK